MRAAPYWHVLGIEPTANEAAVRAAYAEKLKVTNPEDDAEGFKRLRAAYEAALNDARWRARAPPPRPPQDAGVDQDDDSLDDEEYYDDYIDDYLPPIASGPRPLNVPRPRADVAPEPVDPEREAHWQACRQLETLLMSGAPEADVTRAYEAVRSAPAMTVLDVYTATEQWLVHLLHRARPASDILIDRAIADFGWEKAALRVRDRTGAASILGLRKYVAQEKEAKDLIARIQDPRHEFNLAYREITRPFAGRNWLSRQLSLIHAGLMQRFLDYIAVKNPVAEDSFDQDALDWWRAKLSRSKSPNWLWHVLVRGGVGVLIVAGMIAFLPTQSQLAEGTGAPALAQDERSLTRAHCVAETAVLFLPSTATRECERMVELAPDSLLMRQYAGAVALRDVDPQRAMAHFDAILLKSPTDSYALYGAGFARVLSSDPEMRSRGFEMMGQAIAANPGVRSYYEHFHLPGLTEPIPSAGARSFPRRPIPRYDTPPHRTAAVEQSVVDEAMEHFGLREMPSGRVVMECLIGIDGAVSNCLITEESPANLGLGEMALRLSIGMHVAPALRDGRSVDQVPIRFPLSFGPPPETTTTATTTPSP